MGRISLGKFYLTAFGLAVIWAFFCILPEPVVAEHQEIVYSSQYKSVGIYVFSEDDELVEKGNKFFEVAGAEETGGVMLFKSLNNRVVGEEVVCYATKNECVVLNGDTSVRMAKFALFAKIVLDAFCVICLFFVAVASLFFILFDVRMMEDISNMTARKRTLKRMVSNGKDVYYVDGLVNEVLITINQDENHRMIDGFFQVDQVYDRKKREIEPVEGMEVMAVRIRHSWKFVKDDVSLRDLAKAILYKNLIAIVPGVVMLLISLILLIFWS